MRALHKESGHRGVKGTFDKTFLRYWWSGLYNDVREYVKTCPQCQYRAPLHWDEELHPTLYSALWKKVGLDIVYMPMSRGKKFFVAMREDLTGWMEGKPLVKNDSASVSAFVFDWVCRFGVPGMIVNDGGPENKKLTKELMERFRIHNVTIAPYHPQANGLTERGHQQIVDALAKVDEPNKWVDHFNALLWADRVTVRMSTGYTPFRLLYGQDCILPIEKTAISWAMVDWRKVQTRADLLATRVKELERREEDIERAKEYLRVNREKNKRYFDANKRLRDRPLEINDLVLLYDSLLEKQWSRKLDNRWNGPYRITRVCEDRGTYELEELDRTPLKGYFPGARLKRFYPRYGVEIGEEEEAEGN